MDCDSLARWYRWLEYAGFGRALERRRMAFLPELATARRALVLGDGDGRFLAALLRFNRQVCVDAVDSSERMISLARRRARDAAAENRVRFWCADAQEQSWPRGTYDVVVTHFFLDCFGDADLARLVPKIAYAGTDSACWIVSDFRQPTHGFRRWPATAVLAGLYTFFRWTTGLQVRRLPDHATVLKAQGFQLQREETAWGGLLASERWQRAPSTGVASEKPRQRPRAEQNGVGQDAQKGF